MSLIAKIFLLVGSALVVLGDVRDRAPVTVEDIEVETTTLGVVSGTIRATFPGQGFRAGPDHVIAGLVLEPGHWVEDDNRENRYTFPTPQVPDYFTEMFSGDNDLDDLSLVFTPDGSPDHYTGCTESISAFPTDPDGGTPLTWDEGNADDGYAVIDLSGGAMVSLYGTTYGGFYVGTNGYITFGEGDTDYNGILNYHFLTPRISALYDDLDPGAAGTVSWKQLGDRAAVTWENVPEHDRGGSNTFQIEMYFDGTIVISYLSMDTTDGIAGLSEGIGMDPDFWETDLSSMGSCELDCNDNGVPDDQDITEGTSEDCNWNDIPDECDIEDGTSLDCQPNGIPDECDIEYGMSEDTNENGIPDECEEDPYYSWLTVSIDYLDGLPPVPVPTHTDVDYTAALRLAAELEAAGYWERPGDWVPGDFPSPDDQGLFFVQTDEQLSVFGTIEVIFEFTVYHDDSVPFTFPRLTFGAGGVADINQAPEEGPYPVLLVDEPVGQLIPTVSTWGLIIVALMLLVAAKIRFGRGKAVVVS